MTRIVTLGDSITLGMGDPAPGGGWRGWARLLAAGLPKPELHNLAAIGAQAKHVERDQLPNALLLRPHVASVVVGINDTLRAGFDPVRTGQATARTHCRPGWRRNCDHPGGRPPNRQAKLTTPHPERRGFPGSRPRVPVSQAPAPGNVRSRGPQPKSYSASAGIGTRFGAYGTTCRIFLTRPPYLVLLPGLNAGVSAPQETR